MKEVSEGDLESGDLSPEAPETPEAELTEVTPSSWLISEPDMLRKLLGKAQIRRATKLMMRAVPVELNEDKTGLTAVIRETKEYTVRIPRHGGLNASLCSCGSAKCVHRALAVLTACREKICLNLR